MESVENSVQSNDISSKKELESNGKTSLEKSVDNMTIRPCTYLKGTCVKEYYENNKINRPYLSSLNLDTQEFNEVVAKLRSFFISRKFLEVSTQNRLSILAACEDPFNVGMFNYAGNTWPLPQTGQMWLEYELLKAEMDAKAKGTTSPEGYFCLTTSYRMEKNPKEGRHDLIFPLFEFEMKGGEDALLELERDLLTHLGYNPDRFMQGRYRDIADEYNTTELEHEHEQRLHDEKTPTYFITDFPEFTYPFWNMRRHSDNDTSYKVDVILSGQETIGSAERETDKDVMLARFNSIMGGGYKNKLYELFGEERTDTEMEDYLNFDFFQRSGGGIGMTRLIRSMKLEGLLTSNDNCEKTPEVESEIAA
jgi:aspartyl/asparaginyl-tRNA synthetase